MECQCTKNKAHSFQSDGISIKYIDLGETLCQCYKSLMSYLVVMNDPVADGTEQDSSSVYFVDDSGMSGNDTFCRCSCKSR